LHLKLDPASLAEKLLFRKRLKVFFGSLPIVTVGAVVSAAGPPPGGVGAGLGGSCTS